MKILYLLGLGLPFLFSPGLFEIPLPLTPAAFPEQASGAPAIMPPPVLVAMANPAPLVNYVAATSDVSPVHDAPAPAPATDLPTPPKPDVLDPFASDLNPHQAPQAPRVKVTVNGLAKSATVELGHMVHISIERSGGKHREDIVDFDPEIPEEDLVKGPSGDDYYFTAPAGRYSFRLTAIGDETGYGRAEVGVVIRDPRPPVQAGPPSADPIERFKGWVMDVVKLSPEQGAAEAIKVGHAAHVTAEEYRKNPGQFGTPARVVDEWSNAAFLEPDFGLGGSKRWSEMFLMVVEMFNPKVEGYNPANVLDTLGNVLEGKQ